MPDSEARHAESVMVSLARMEGKIDKIDFKIDTLTTRVDRHETEIGTLKSAAQTLADGAKASKDTAEALALAVKDAKETAEATGRKEAAQVEAAAKEADNRAALGWSPVTKVFAVASVLFGLLASYALLRPGG